MLNFVTIVTMKKKPKTLTVEDLLKGEGALEAILFKQGRIIHSMRHAAQVDEDCPTELIPDIIESIIETNKKLRKENNKLKKLLAEEKGRD